MNLSNNISNLISDSEDILFEISVNSDLLYYPKKILNSAAKPLAKKAGVSILHGLKRGAIKLKEKSSELDDLSRAKHKVDKANSELYAAKLTKNKDNVGFLNKKVSIYDQSYKSLQQEHINKKQKYIQKTKEMELRISELRQSGKEPETLKSLEAKHQKRKAFLDKLGINSNE